jgi:hypothetical protein
LTSTPPWSPHTRNLPLHDFAQNQIWCAIVALACELTTWMQTLALADTTPAVGNPNGCDYGCSPSLDASPTPAATSYYTYPRTHLGPTLAIQAITTLQALPAPG